ncbi:MAG: hypothetical protein QW520_03950 [Methanomassiliicoccales archaeon]
MRPTSLRDFFPDRYARRLESSQSIAEIFELVRDAVEEREGVRRYGLMLGLAVMKGDEDRMPGGLHPLASNMILLNKAALSRVQSLRPELLKSFIFHVLLYEYLHTLGVGLEEDLRNRALEISTHLFGKDHPVTILASGMSKLLPFIVYAERAQLPAGTKIESVAEKTDLDFTY